MKVLFLYCFVFVFITRINAQANLVPNPSFEIFSSCILGNVGYGGGPCCPIGWDNPTVGSPDYYNSTSPCNILGLQYPRTGQAYVGFYAFGEGSTPGLFDVREYVQTELIDTLIAGKKYCVEFYISLADWGPVAVTQVGSYFSNTAISSINMLPLPYTAQITSPSGIYITDTVNWTKVSGVYNATGGEKFITIGNFNDVANTDTVSITEIGQKNSYYYLDDVFIGKCADNTTTNITIPNVFTPNNDGINDEWEVNILPSGTHVKIYNRWGILVGGVEDMVRVQGTYKWDGRTTSGIMCNEGVYYYIITTEEKTYKGFIQLLK